MHKKILAVQKYKWKRKENKHDVAGSVGGCDPGDSEWMK